MDPDRGLSEDEARARLLRYGPNALPEKRPPGVVQLFLRQFRSPLIYLLLGAAALAFAVGERRDAGIIVVVLLSNAAFGMIQERRAERSMAALKELVAPRARVVRGGFEREIDSTEVVPGDVLAVAAGDAIVADGRVLRAEALQVNESALTGESTTVSKARWTPAERADVLAERPGVLHAGTHVTAGRGRAVVFATGPATEVGHIAAMTAGTKEPKTPLEARIDRLGRVIVVAAAVLAVAVLLLGLARGVPVYEMVMLAASQLCSMVPEGLPVAVTVLLALGVRRMSQRGAIIRRLSAVETLGSVSTICTDKTGTLTKNEMTVAALFLPSGRRLRVGGSGYAPEGKIEDEAGRAPAAGDPDVSPLLEAIVLCNDARLEPPQEPGGRWRTLGDPTEIALLTAARKGGASPERLRDLYPRVAEIPFDPKRKLMATGHRGADGPFVVVKAAPEIALALSARHLQGGRPLPMTAREREAVRDAIQRLAGQALRVLGIAVFRGRALEGEEPAASLERLLGHGIFLGLVAQTDPPRPEVRDAIARCREAGTRIVMITGDHHATGLAVARALGIASTQDLAIDGAELDAMSDAELLRRLSEISVFARVEPAQKLRIVEALQARDDVVAMTGDGVNDAPSLARADVGVAMGLAGTEVAKSVAKMTITDDNFATIVAAIEEGRAVHRSLKRVLLYLVSTSGSEVLVLFIALALGLPPPLAAVQILWVNLVTDGVVTVPLVMDRGSRREMGRTPTPRDAPLVDRASLGRLAVMMPAITLSTLAYYAVRLRMGVPPAHARTEAFTMLAVCQWYNALNCRSSTASALRLDVLGNPWLVGGIVLGNVLHAAVIFVPALNDVFHTVPLPLSDALAIGVVASLVLWAEELRKLVARRRRRRASAREALERRPPEGDALPSASR